MAELDSLGGKRKYKENPLTAQAENGSLKIKILRKDEKRRIAAAYGSGGAAVAAPASPVLLGASQPRASVPAPTAAVMTSPPKPRPNRKHVPIFYQRPNAFEFSMTSSTDESATQSTSQQRVDDIDGVDDRAVLAAQHWLQPRAGAAAADESLFMRGTSQNGAGSIDNLLKHVFPTLAPGSSHDFGHMPMGPRPARERLPPSAAALHQLASSSTAYDSRRREFTNGSTATCSKAPSSSSSSSSSGAFPYRFDPMTALQDAVKMATATATSTSSPSSTSAPQQSHYGHDDGDLGPPPMAPPSFGVQHSLVGGGIEAQPVIANVNTRSFDWNKHQDAANSNGRPRSGSLPEAFPSDEGDVNEHGHAPVHIGKRASERVSGRRITTIAIAIATAAATVVFFVAD
ncbi:hypothetical protein PINS_up024163 [Pythium insidiosum]|nr:hypothetical protein PINS_up024163 [Pythium insidiosum]